MRPKLLEKGRTSKDRIVIYNSSDSLISSLLQKGILYDLSLTGCLL